MARTDILFNVAGGDIVLKEDDMGGSAIYSFWSRNNLSVSSLNNNGSYVKITYNNLNTLNMTINGTTAKAMLWGKIQYIRPCQLPLITTKGIVYIRKEGSIYVIYSGENADFQVGEARKQNTSFLLLCKPGNSYRYPTSGVNIRSFINGREMTKRMLADKIIEEFAKDNVSVISADFDTETGTINLKTEEQ